jgi:energy-converting hydrogenase Eha subunit C
MGVVLMSKRELNRIDVLARLDGGRLTTLAAAELVRVTPAADPSVVEAIPR